MSSSADDTRSSQEPHPSPCNPPRRRFLARIALTVGGVAGAVTALPFVAFLLSPLRRETEGAWRGVGRAADFPVASTVRVTFLDARPLPWAGFAAQSAAWLRRIGEDQFEAFSTYCTHVGCPVRWEQGAELFLCPCHGGAFYRDGSVAAGPPPHPLARYPVRVRDGEVEILTPPIPLTGSS